MGEVDADRARAAAPALADGGPGGERGVHEHDVGADGGQPVADALRVVPGDGRLGIDGGKQRAAQGGQLVEVEVRGGVEDARREGGEDAGARGRFEDHVVRAHGGGREGGVGEGEGRRELVVGDLVLGAVRLRRLQRRDALEHAVEALRIAAGPVAHGGRPALEEEHDGGLGGVVGVLRVPGVALPRGRVAEGVGDRGARVGRGHGPSRLEGGNQGAGRGSEGLARGECGGLGCGNVVEVE